MPPRFVYFDLGNVLLNFDHHLAARQMAAVAGVPEEIVWNVVFAGDLGHQHELGALDDQQFYEQFCQLTNSRPDRAALERAGSDIFALNIPIMSVVAALDGAGYPLGILSNTSHTHWQWCGQGRYGIIFHAFRVHALSFEIKACKPDAKIFEAAAALAKTPPEQIFYVDDIAGHVAGAKRAGFDAVQYTTVPALVEELHARGVRMNY